jgi:hypothetical protein
MEKSKLGQLRISLLPIKDRRRRPWLIVLLAPVSDTRPSSQQAILESVARKLISGNNTPYMYGAALTWLCRRFRFNVTYDGPQLYSHRILLVIQSLDGFGTTPSQPADALILGLFLVQQHHSNIGV